MPKISADTKRYYRERVRSIMVQEPMISGEGIRRHLEKQGLVLDRNYINGLVNQIHRERAKRADTWMLNAALTSFQDAMSEIARVGWEIANDKFAEGRDRAAALREIREAYNAMFEKLFDAGVFERKLGTLDATIRSTPLSDEKKQAIYEVDFKGFSYGFRPGRSPHQALDALTVGIQRKKVNWILDADVMGFFDNLNHEWAIKFIEHRVADRRILRLIQKWLKAGVSEGGQWSKTDKGTPQGAVASPLIANVYLHYLFDLWADVWRRKAAKGDVIIVRYADDVVLGFQQRADAVRFLEAFKERLAKFGLELHPDKTRLIEFGRYAARERKRRGEGKPETFNFLGFTHFCGQRHKTETFTVWRITAKKRMVAKLKIVKAELQRRKHDRTSQVGVWLRSVVTGYYQYHAVPGNIDQLRLFRKRVNRLWHAVLVRRSQRARKKWERFAPAFDRWIPPPRVLHPYPDTRFYATHPS